MALNVEIKARLPDPASLETALTARTGSASAILHQEDTFFTVCKGRLKLRCDPSGRGELIYYLREDGPGPVVSRFIRTPVEDASSARAELIQMFGLKSVVRKRRKLFMIGPTRVHLDEVEGLAGAFVEIELPLERDEQIEQGKQTVRQLMEELSIASDDVLACAYEDLLRDESTAG